MYRPLMRKCYLFSAIHCGNKCKCFTLLPGCIWPRVNISVCSSFVPDFSRACELEYAILVCKLPKIAPVWILLDGTKKTKRTRAVRNVGAPSRETISNWENLRPMEILVRVAAFVLNGSCVSLSLSLHGVRYLERYTVHNPALDLFPCAIDGMHRFNAFCERAGQFVTAI